MKLYRTGLLVFLSLAASGSAFAPATLNNISNVRSCINKDSPNIVNSNTGRITPFSKYAFSTRANSRSTRFMTENEEMEEPLGKGVDSVSWLPTVIGAQPSDPESEVSRISEFYYQRKNLIPNGSINLFFDLGC